VATAVARGLGSAGLTYDLAPVADGGEGTLEVLAGRFRCKLVWQTTVDPLGRAVTASFGLLGDGTTALVEVAAASGLGLVAPEDRDAEAASSAGTGELIASALRAGARHVVVAAGGSATTDGGDGAIEALNAAGGLRDGRLTVLCDVQTPFEDAAAVFAPQKGADSAAVVRLSARLAARGLPRGIPMSGAAGGLAGGLRAAFGAQLVGGAAFVLDALDFDRRMVRSRAVIVGEGRLDATSFHGKIASEIARRAGLHGVAVHAIVGGCAVGSAELEKLGLQELLEATDEAAIEAAARRLADIISASHVRRSPGSAAAVKSRAHPGV
jgi:glycerate kinase